MAELVGAFSKCHSNGPDIMSTTTDMALGARCGLTDVDPDAAVIKKSVDDTEVVKDIASLVDQPLPYTLDRLPNTLICVARRDAGCSRWS